MDYPSTVLITGGATRIGAAFARDLAAAGATVCVHYNSSAAAAEALVEDIRQASGQAVAVGSNLLDDADLTQTIARAEDALGAPVHCLINNASVFKGDAAGVLAPELFATHFGIHATAAAVLADRMVNGLPNDAEGLIVNIIDQRVWRLTPNFISYTASKVALWGLTQTLAQAYADSTNAQVRVNAIGPGPTLSNERQDPADFQKQVNAVPLSRGPDLADFAATVLYLWQMKSITGQMIALDGGQHLAWETPDVVGIVE